MVQQVSSVNLDAKSSAGPALTTGQSSAVSAIDSVQGPLSTTIDGFYSTADVQLDALRTYDFYR